MIKLQIKNADGSIYWTENFNDQSSCDAWIAEEKTRPYWDATRTTSIIEILPPVPSLEEKALAKAKADQENLDELLRKAAKDKIKKVDLTKISDPVVADAINHIRILLSKWN